MLLPGTTTQAKVAAESSTTSATGSNAAMPGRRMMSTPAKPTATAVQRAAVTVSFSSRTASTVANSGAVKLNAVASASGIAATAMNSETVEATKIADRTV